MSSSNRSELVHWFAPCPRGLEPALVEELNACDAQRIQPTAGGVAFAGAADLAYRVNLRSRVTSRVLRRVAEAPYQQEDDIFRLASSVNWRAWFNTDNTIKVETVGIKSPLRSLDFITLRVKDAICDQFRKATGARPSVNTEAPDVRIHVFLTERHATLYLDTSGENLFKRGWRLEKGLAPLRENLAAGLLHLAGWNGSQPLIDPFCGSGTIAIEAAHIAQHIAPGIARPFGFEKLKNFDRGLWRQLKTEAEQQRLERCPVPILANDISGKACGMTSQNAKRAGVEIQVSMLDARELRPLSDQPGLILGNPPYGERIGLRHGQEVQSADSSAIPDAAFYAEFASTLKKHFAGWRVALISNDMNLPRQLRLQPKRKIPVFNGALECRLFIFDMIAGSNRKD